MTWLTENCTVVNTVGPEVCEGPVLAEGAREGTTDGPAVDTTVELAEGVMVGASLALDGSTLGAGVVDGPSVGIALGSTEDRQHEHAGRI